MYLPFEYSPKLALPKGLIYSGTYDERPVLSKQQEIVLEKLNAVLSQKNIKFSQVWYGEFLFENTNRKASNFAMLSECGKVLWRRYEGNTPGGSLNSIFILDNKTTVSKWLANPYFPE